MFRFQNVIEKIYIPYSYLNKWLVSQKTSVEWERKIECLHARVSLWVSMWVSKSQHCGCNHAKLHSFFKICTEYMVHAKKEEALVPGLWLLSWLFFMLLPHAPGMWIFSSHSYFVSSQDYYCCQRMTGMWKILQELGKPALQEKNIHKGNKK